MLSSFNLRILAAAMVLSGGLSYPSFAAAYQVATEAQTSSDYVEFRKLSEPLKLIDLYLALNIYEEGRNPALTKHSAKWRSVFAAAVERGIRQRQGVIIDLVMKDVMKSFNHDEIERLTILCANPSVARYQAAKVQDLRAGDMAMTTAENEFRNDPDRQTMSPADLDLVGRLIYGMDASFGATSKDEPIKAMMIQALKEANAAASF